MKYYIVCSQERSGTHFLANSLAEGNAGFASEKFSEVRLKNDINFLYDSIGDNICGASLLASYCEDHLDFIRKNLGYENITDNYELLMDLYPNAKFIYLHRRNKIKQAISWCKLEITRNQSLKDGPDVDVSDYDYSKIQHNIKRCVLGDAFWLDFFEKYNIRAYFVTYELLCRDYLKELSGVLDFLGMPPLKESPTLHFEQMYNDISEIWYQKTKEKMGDRS